jgi:hypothetical protein
MLVVMLKDWVTKNHKTEWRSKSFTSLANSASERVSRRLVDDNDVDSPGPDLRATAFAQELEQRRQFFALPRC